MNYFSSEGCDRSQLFEKQSCQKPQCPTRGYGYNNNNFMPFPTERGNSWSDRGIQSDGLVRHQVGILEAEPILRRPFVTITPLIIF